RELNGATSSWRLQDHNTGEILASGNGLGSEAIVNFDDVTTSKVNLLIDNASDAPQIAEFEVYNASGAVSSSSSSESSSSSSEPSSSSSSSSSAANETLVLEESDGFCG